MNIEEREKKDYIFYKTETNQFVYFEVEETLNKFIDLDNIILVADDPLYDIYLEGIKEKGSEINLIKYSEDFDTKIFTRIKWTDIAYPIAIALGLEKFEL